MPPTRLKAVAAFLMLSLTLAGLAVLVAGRVRTPCAILVTIVGTRGDIHAGFLANYTAVNIVPELRRTPGVAATNVLGRRGVEMRIQLDPDRMRAQNVSVDDVVDSLTVTTMIDPDGQTVPRTVRTGESQLIHFGWRYARADQYGEIILRATPDGEVVRIKDVGRVEAVKSAADRTIEVDGRPAAAIVLTPTTDPDAAGVVAAVTDQLRICKESFPPGMDFEITPLDDGTVIGAEVQLPENATLDATVDRCRELADQARRFEGVASVITLAGYDLRTEHSDWNVGTCLIRTRPGASPGLATLRGQCPVAGADVGFFEPPGVRMFGSAAGLSVRVLDQSGASIPETFLRDLSAPGDRADLLTLLAASFPDRELILNADVARRHGISIPEALAARFRVEDGDPDGWPPRRLVEETTRPKYTTDRGETVPYRWFLRLR